MYLSCDLVLQHGCGCLQFHTPHQCQEAYSSLQGRNVLAHSLHPTSLPRSVKGLHVLQTDYFVFPVDQVDYFSDIV